MFTCYVSLLNGTLKLFTFIYTYAVEYFLLPFELIDFFLYKAYLNFMLLAHSLYYNCL